MISSRYFLMMAVFGFLMSFLFLGGAVVALIAGSNQSSNQFVLYSLVWNFLAILATWLTAWTVQHAARLEKLESELRRRPITTSLFIDDSNPSLNR